MVAGSDELQSADDYGARLYVVAGDKLLYRSHGMMDSYYLELTFLRASATAAALLILAESGDEGGSYGVSVFELRGQQVRDLGSVDALIEGGEQLLSVVPHLRVTTSGAGYEFRVTREVLILDRELYEYRSIARQKIRYLYDGEGQIKRVIDP